MKITQAVFIKENLAKRFEKCKLELHPVKTRIVYCKDKDRTREEELSKFDFLARENAKRYNIHINDMKGGGQHEKR